MTKLLYLAMLPYLTLCIPLVKNGAGDLGNMDGFLLGIEQSFYFYSVTNLNNTYFILSVNTGLS